MLCRLLVARYDADTAVLCILAEEKCGNTCLWPSRMLKGATQRAAQPQLTSRSVR